MKFASLVLIVAGGTVAAIWLPNYLMAITQLILTFLVVAEHRRMDRQERELNALYNELHNLPKAVCDDED